MGRPRRRPLGVRAAGAGTLGGAASWLNRRDFAPVRIDEADDHRIRWVLAARDDEWRADLAHRLALRLRGPRYTGLDLALALLAETGAEPPDHDPLVVGWVGTGPPRPKDPLLPVLLPRRVRGRGVGRACARTARGPAPSPRWPPAATSTAPCSWTAASAASCAAGPTSNCASSSACTTCSRTTSRPPGGATRPPAPATTSGCSRPRPAPSRPWPSNCSANCPACPRTGWPRRSTGCCSAPRPGSSGRDCRGSARPSATGPTRRTTARAPSPARSGTSRTPCRRRRCGSRSPSPPGRTRPARRRRPAPPARPRAQVTARFGGDFAAAEQTDVDPAPEALAPAAAPAPEARARREPGPPPERITTRPRSAGALAGSVRDIESLLEGFVRLAGTDPDAVRATVAPAPRLDDFPGRYHGWRTDWEFTHQWMRAAAGMLADPASVPADWRDRMGCGSDGPLGRLELHRAAEILGAVERGTLPPLLLATPTAPTGHVAPDVLADRLRTLADAGVEPGPADLQQALLRLPPGPHPEASSRAAAIDTPAARTAARWLAAPPVPRPSLRDREGGGLPETVIDLDGLDGPLADPELDTTFPFPDDAPSDADEVPGIPAEVWARARQGATGGMQFGVVRRIRSSSVLLAEHYEEDEDAPGGAVSGAGDDAVSGAGDGAPSGEGDGAGPQDARGAWESMVVRPEDVPAEGRTVRVSAAAWSSFRSPRRSRRERLGLVDGGPTGLPLVDAVFTDVPQYPSQYGGPAVSWSRTIPSHPEVAAAHLVPQLRDHGRFIGRWNSSVVALLELVPANGMYAEHVAEFLAHRFGYRERRPDQVFLDICARGELPAAAVGRNVARLLLEGEARPSHVTDGLRQAAEAGAFADVWRVLAAALPMLCPEPGTRPVQGLDRLFELGARTARWCGARGAIPEVDALAARTGSAAYLRAARGLAARLTGP
ncbi:hypothetical protein BJF79_34035 [Actinomadura sp. CNU-125]|uniref:hypothetical protein n=1 Tax=Actinomadura sp. CNU-125 TaxID=1904961 RepID=UPI00095AEB8C|nr:hypothetical protein [Actinomadura sp. CNU-125]OLT34014.1 hypothetical protein BJF79_34035 [Actinomadura sp. CNU-125]